MDAADTKEGLEATEPQQEIKMEEEPQQQKDTKASEPFPFQSNPYGTARGVDGAAAGGGAPEIAGDSSTVDQAQNTVNSNNSDGVVDNGPTQQPVDATKVAEHKQDDNDISNAAVSQQKAAIIQQSKESEIIVDNAPVTVPTIGSTEEADGDSI